MSKEQNDKIAVIGSGVIGLTTAIEAQRAGYKEVTIYTEKPPKQTTSMKAGAVFEPYRPGKMSTEEMLQFVRTGLRRYEQIMHDFPESETGIWPHDLYSTSTEMLNPAEIPFLPAMPHWQLLVPPEVPGYYRSAILLESVPFIDPTIALPWLAQEFERNQGIIKSPYRRITDLSEFIEHTPEDIIVNCSGLGARDLLGDAEIVPMRGQIAVVSYRPGWDFSILGDDGYYIFPRRNETIIGGTTEEGVWDETPEVETIDRLIANAQRIMPDLRREDLVRSYAGLRPYRTSGVKVAIEQRGNKRHIMNVGFGGSGWTFCWGAAEKAIGLASEGRAEDPRETLSMTRERI